MRPRRGYYFDNAPELAPYLLSVPPAERLRVQGLGAGRWQGYRTVAGMVAVVTAVLADSAAALAAILASDHSLAAALISGPPVELSALIALMRFQDSVWKRASAEPLIVDEGGRS